MKKLKKLLKSIADQSYQKIQLLTGCFQFSYYSVQFIKIQGSPGANPASIASVAVSIKECGLPLSYLDSPLKRIAVADFLIRRFNEGINQFAQQNRGKQGSGSFHTVELGQTMLQRDCVLFCGEQIELRFVFSLPAKGTGVIDANQAWIMFEQELTSIVDYTFFYHKFTEATKELLRRTLDIQEARLQIKQYMQKHGLCVFINNGASLVRRSGVDDRPDENPQTIRFQSPKETEVEIPLSATSSIKGMGIKEGVCCITGGGYHGKSTLLQAILAGVYAHIPDDGREFVVTRDDAVFVRAEEGRSIKGLDISAFIANLPNGIDTHYFSSDNASGSTSQAASLVESIEMGSRLLLFDEDTCANNLLLRDDLIEKVLDAKHDPIKPLYSKLRSLWQQQGVSMIFVVGGLGLFLQKADTCLLMDNYQCKDITAKIRAKLGGIVEDDGTVLKIANNRVLAPDNFNPSYTNYRLKKTLPKRIKDLRNAPKCLEYGMDLVNLEAVPQLVEAPQLLCIGYCLLKIQLEMQAQGVGGHTIEYWLKWLYKEIDAKGLSYLQPDYPGTLSLPRQYEVSAAINRIRSLNIIDNFN